MKNLSCIIEGILFLAGDPIPMDDIAQKLGVSQIEILESIAELKSKYMDSGMILLEVDGKYQFATNQKYIDDISSVLSPIREKEFSQSMMEVVSIIAYKQPITRLEIEKIRGVSSEYALNALIKQNIIATVGRKDAVGKPFLFGTTDNFLKKFNLKNIKQLPNYDTLIAQINEISSDDDMDLFALEEDGILDELPNFLNGENVEEIG